LSRFSDFADDLMADDQREFRIRQFPIHDVQISAADSARAHLDENLARAGLRLGSFEQTERLPRSFENHCAHVTN
jgi:hypothetical protein